ncbi:hypothetical protein FXF51_07165 [Nonomuraea sp. PA05]|uniref:hypothetical protein n=1 Tax=Nonomuraea sp. PA05 TaxID=2604466 RepID=UPI0011D73ADF|nr:hypothetical protein [Nonomuraea sp. PA05]TYB69923.1 hypothetical protein FXF51_07165 [Nonomuraea sp. PA05]
MTEPSGGSTDKPRRPVVVPALALVTFTAVGITALLGGLNEAPEQPDPLSEGAVLDQGLYSTKFVGSRVKIEPAQNDWDEEKRFVELVFNVTNNSDETLLVGLPPEKVEQAFSSTFFAGSLVKIDPAFTHEDAGPFAYALSKGGETRQLHPGVPTEVILRYKLQKGQQPPAKITLDVASFEFTAQFNNNVEAWRMIAKEVGEKHLPEIKARVTMSVKKGDPA